MIEKRRGMMQEWADFLATAEKAEAKKAAEAEAAKNPKLTKSHLTRIR